MLVKEILDTKTTIEEGWKEKAASLGLAGVIGIGAVGGLSSIDKQSSKKPAELKILPIEKSGIEPITNSPLEFKLISAAMRAGLKGEELAQFLAQCAHETDNFRKMTERGSINYFRRYDKRFAPTTARKLGNVQPGDGEKFKGRGYIQLTGRYNYKIAGKSLNLPLEERPELAADPDIAAKIALWYWNRRVKPNVDDFSDTVEVTKNINAKLLGLKNRHVKFIDYLGATED